MPDGQDLRVTWLGHSTALLEMGGTRILTDPFLRDRLGPLRRHGPTPDVESLGPIDAVLISHAHPDHFDRASLSSLAGDPLVVVPSGLGGATSKLGLRTMELVAGQGLTVGGVQVTAVPARHGRWPRHPQATTIGFLLHGPSSIYVAGDTSWFAELAQLVQGVDLALLPIGSWGPHQAPWHLGPVGAARLAMEIGARAVIPVHWGTLYPTGLHRVWSAPLSRPGIDFERAAARLAPGVDIRILRPGDTASFGAGRG
jgi:L-ascorbate metabolism protein UlaG (beta-lactamase superfamily)